MKRPGNFPKPTGDVCMFEGSGDHSRSARSKVARPSLKGPGARRSCCTAANKPPSPAMAQLRSGICCRKVYGILQWWRCLASNDSSSLSSLEEGFLLWRRLLLAPSYTGWGVDPRHIPTSCSPPFTCTALRGTCQAMPHVVTVKEKIQLCCKTGRNKTQATFFRSNPNPLWRFNSHIPQRILTHVSLTDVSCSDLGGETYYVAIKNPHSWCIARGKSRLMSILSISWNIWGTWRPSWNDLGESKTKDGITNFWNLLRKLIKMTTKKGQRVKES